MMYANELVLPTLASSISTYSSLVFIIARWKEGSIF